MAAPDTTAGPLLDPGFLARLERLQLGTRRPLWGRLAGEHRSRRHGSSIDFADFREYQPGDDWRRIDYAAYARLDTLLVRLFEADDDVHVRLLIDTSASMATGGKLRQAARLAAAIGFVALVRRDPVSVHTFPLDAPAPRFIGRDGVPALFGLLGSLEPHGPTPFATAAAHLLARPGPRGLTVLLSDLLTADWDAGLGRLPARGDHVTVVHVLAAEDLEPLRVDRGGDETLAGDVDLVDAETGARLAVTLSDDVLRAYQRAATAWADGVAARCARASAAYVRVDAAADIEPLLLTGWRTAGVLR